MAQPLGTLTGFIKHQGRACSRESKRVGGRAGQRSRPTRRFTRQQPRGRRGCFRRHHVLHPQPLLDSPAASTAHASRAPRRWCCSPPRPLEASLLGPPAAPPRMWQPLYSPGRHGLPHRPRHSRPGHAKAHCSKRAHLLRASRRRLGPRARGEALVVLAAQRARAESVAVTIAEGGVEVGCEGPARPNGWCAAAPAARRAGRPVVTVSQPDVADNAAPLPGTLPGPGPRCEHMRRPERAGVRIGGKCAIAAARRCRPRRAAGLRSAALTAATTPREGRPRQSQCRGAPAQRRRRRRLLEQQRWDGVRRGRAPATGRGRPVAGGRGRIDCVGAEGEGSAGAGAEAGMGPNHHC